MAKAPATDPPQEVTTNPPLAITFLPLASLHAHPRNYQTHPEDELEHIRESLRQHGFYRPIIIANDAEHTILAGHGVWQAAQSLGHETGPVVQLPYAPNDALALKVLTGDNEIRHLAEVDDRALTELLREIVDLDGLLLGTGYDEMMLANLLTVTRTAEEIPDFDAAAEWVGMPEYDERGEDRIQITVNFVTEEDRTAFYRALNLSQDDIVTRGTKKAIWWPKPQVRHDLRSVLFTTGDGLPDATDAPEDTEDA